jgi:hypothetical protein
MAPQPSFRSFVGFAKESTPGTAITTPTDYLVCKLDPSQQITQLQDMGWRGSQVDAYGQQQGKRFQNLAFTGDVFVDTFGILLKGILGDEVLTGAGAPYTHAFSLLNTGSAQPPTWTVLDFYSVSQKAFAYTMFSEVKLSLNPDGLLTWTAAASAFWPTTPAAPTASFTALTPMQGWRALATINGASAQITKCDISIKRALSVVKTSNGTQDPYAIWGGPVSVDISTTGLYETDVWATDIAADNQGVFDLTLDRFAAAAEEKLIIHCTKTAYNVADRRRGDPFITADMTLKPTGNTTDVGASGGYSPVKCTLLNARSTAY